jgi:hypothetical protein
MLSRERVVVGPHGETLSPRTWDVLWLAEAFVVGGGATFLVMHAIVY